MKNNRTQIHAEIIQLQDILKSIDEDAVIERMGYEHRLNELTQKQLKHLTLPLKVHLLMAVVVSQQVLPAKRQICFLMLTIWLWRL